MPKTILKTISIAKDFSDTPGPRARDEGNFSGQEFLETLLLPAYEEALRQDCVLLIDLDGTEGYATSFLEATFGELARRFPQAQVVAHLDFKSDDEPYLIQEIEKYIAEARK